MKTMIPYGRQDINQADIDAVVAVLRADFLTQGPAVPAFENAVANYCDAQNAVAVNSATSALHIACLALGVGITSVAMGASIIEKHFTLHRSGGGPDDSFSLAPLELAALCKDSKTAWAALGRVDYGRKSSKQSNVKFRRSLYFVKGLKAGDVITADAVRSVRPGFGLAPKYLEHVLGKPVKQDVKARTALSWELLS